LTLLPPPDSLTLYVVFEPAPPLPIYPWWFRAWLRITRGQPQHCFTMTWTGTHWLGLQAGACWLDVADLGTDPCLPGILAAMGNTVVQCVRIREPRWFRRGLTTCVSLAKMQLGIRAVSVTTPAGLLRYLVREGQHVVEWSHGISTGQTQAHRRRHRRTPRA